MNDQQRYEEITRVAAYLFEKLTIIFPGWQASVKLVDPEQWAASQKKLLRYGLIESNVTTREQIEKGLRLAMKKAETGHNFMPPMPEVVRWCKGSTIPYHKDFPELTAKEQKQLEHMNASPETTAKYIAECRKLINQGQEK